MKKRSAKIERKSTETQIRALLTIDGKGAAKIKTQIGLLDHMLELFTFHGCFDLALEVKRADLNIDAHHTNEDIGIVLGKAFKEALKEKTGIQRFGWAFAPMEATLGQCVIDLSGRGYLTVNSNKPGVSMKDAEGYSMDAFEHFLESFAHTLGATVHVRIENPSNDLHTNLETVFKSLGLALKQACALEPRRGKKIPSTKGIID